MNELRTMLSLAVLAAACSNGSQDPSQEPTTAATSSAIESPDHGQTRVLRNVTQTDLVSDQQGVAAHQDTNLVNAWGIAFSPTGTPWVSDNGTGLTTVYDATGVTKLTVTIPPPAGGTTSAPTGQVFNADATSFAGDKFIFVTEDGTISGWQSGASAMLRVDRSTSGAVYKGVTLAMHRNATRLYAANFHAGTVDVFDASYRPIAERHAFIDERLPHGYAPFNVHAANGLILVSYALQDDAAHDDVKGVGHGFIDAFDSGGRFLSRLVSHGTLDSPWGMAIAPESFAGLGGRLLVGNFGDGRINVYSLELSRFGLDADHEGVLGNASGQPLVIDGLWAIVFAPEAGAVHANQLFFSAGPDGEQHGLFGHLDAIASH